VEVDMVGEHGPGNPEGLNDLGEDGEEGDFGLCRKNWDGSSTPNCM